MTWIVRIPKRPDFCGCPPCPLCYNWGSEPPAGRVQDKWVQEIIDGMSKFKGDMLGGRAPTANETEVLNAAAEAIHVGNLSFSQRVDEEFKAADKAQHTKRQMDAFLAEKRADAARPPPVEAKACLDDMDLSKINDPPPKPNDVWVTFGSPMFSAMDFASVYAAATKRMEEVAFAPPKMDDKDKRRIQAEADAKKKMKAQSRGYVKVGR